MNKGITLKISEIEKEFIFYALNRVYVENWTKLTNPHKIHLGDIEKKNLTKDNQVLQNLIKKL